jgi:murein DD-endopeptidase MepM/ murein hydrolase activator NlpD
MRKSFLLSLLLAAAAYLLLPMPGISSSLPQQIGKARQRIAGKRQQEGVLTTQISGYQLQIRGLQADISSLQQRQDRAQVELNQKESELIVIGAKLNTTRDRLNALRTQLAAAKKVLADRLVALYKDNAPDMVTVVLDANGFADLLDRAEFVSRIGDQDTRIVTQVRDLTNQVNARVNELAGLEAKARVARNTILVRRNEIAAAKAPIVTRQNALIAVRNRRAAALNSIQASRSDLEGHLHDLVNRQSQIEAKLQAAAAGVPTAAAGPIKQGSGSFIWPVNGPIASPFGPRVIGGRSEFHPGIDIVVPTGTPIRASAAGTVTLEQPEAASGGYGNFTCIQHTAVISTCYAHQEQFIAHVGQHVAQGQVIGISDCTGRCFGPHVHFEVRVNGSVVNPLGYL